MSSHVARVYLKFCSFKDMFKEMKMLFPAETMVTEMVQQYKQRQCRLQQQQQQAVVMLQIFHQQPGKWSYCSNLCPSL